MLVFIIFMIFQLIQHVLLTPTIVYFHDQMITSHPGVLGITWSPLNIGIAFTEMSSEMQDCLFPILGIARNMKRAEVFFYIPFPERHTDSHTLMEKLEHVSIPYQSHEKILCFQQYHLSEIWVNTKLILLICLLPIWHLFLCGFIWWRINWRYGKNIEPLHLIIPGIMRILLAFSYFPT